jgi:hypothetical protein
MIDRPYTYTDPEAIQRCESMLLAFDDHMADFQALDPSFDATFRNDWRAAIDACIAYPTDESTLDLQKGHGQTINEAMEQCRLALADLRYYANKAYGTKGRYRVFGFERHNKLRGSTANYAVFMHTQHRLALRFQPDLAAKGMTALQIHALLITATALWDAEVGQETFKRERILHTVERSEAFRHLWSFVQRLQHAADAIFENDAVGRGLFVG